MCWIAGFVVQLSVDRYGLSCHVVASSHMMSELDGWVLAHRLFPQPGLESTMRILARSALARAALVLVSGLVLASLAPLTAQAATSTDQVSSTMPGVFPVRGGCGCDHAFRLCHQRVRQFGVGDFIGAVVSFVRL